MRFDHVIAYIGGNQDLSSRVSAGAQGKPALINTTWRQKMRRYTLSNEPVGVAQERNLQNYKLDAASKAGEAGNIDAGQICAAKSAMSRLAAIAARMSSIFIAL